MRHVVLLSTVLIGLTVLPLYNSSKTTCDIEFDFLGRYDYYSIYRSISGYENMSSFDIKTTDIGDAYHKMRTIIDYANIPRARTANYQHFLDIPRLPRLYMTLQEIFKYFSKEIRHAFRDKNDTCPWLDFHRREDLLPTEINLEKKLMKYAEPLFKYLFRFITDSPSRESLTQSPVIKNLFKDEKNIQLYDLLHLVGLQIRNPMEETKMLLKMTLTELIREYVNTEAISTLSCYMKQLDNNIFLQFSGVSKNEYHDYIDMLVNMSLFLIEEHGLSPFKELAYTLVEELELINIHDVTFNWYALIMNTVEAIEEIGWNENLEKGIDAWTQCLMTMRDLLDEIFCHKWPGIEKNMLQMLDNLESDALIAFLDNITPVIVRKIEYCSQKAGYCIYPYYQDLFLRLTDQLFTISQDSVDLPLTAYLKTNRGAINQLFTYEMVFLGMKEFLESWLIMIYREIYYDSLDDFDATVRSLGIWINQRDFPLFTNVNFTDEDRDLVLEPIRQVYDAFPLFVRLLVTVTEQW